MVKEDVEKQKNVAEDVENLEENLKKAVKEKDVELKEHTLNTLANPPLRGGSTVSYGAGFPKAPWSLGPVSIQANKPSCFDNYSHGKK